MTTHSFLSVQDICYFVLSFPRIFVSMRIVRCSRYSCIAFPVRSALTSALDFGVPVLLLSRMAGLGSTCGVIDLEIPSLLLCVFAFHHCVLVPIPSNDSFQEESITR